jgi:hypothetical protein
MEWCHGTWCDESNMSCKVSIVMSEIMSFFGSTPNNNKTGPMGGHDTSWELKQLNLTPF